MEALMKILLAIDDSKFSEAAVRMVASSYNPAKTSLRVLHVVEPLETPYYPELAPPYPTSLDDIKNSRLQAGRVQLAPAVKKLEAAGFAVESSVCQGHARTTIVDAAAKWKAKLIVLGSHGRKGLAKLLLGSVSEYVVRHAPCSVQIVRV
jgi:nucleotide-binding universal stress UspA family protein